VGLALGCVGLPSLMSLSSVPIRLDRHMSSWPTCCYWLVVASCSSMVHLHSVHRQCCSRGSIVRTRTVAVRHCERVVVTTRSFDASIDALFDAVCERVIVV